MTARSAGRRGSGRAFAGDGAGDYRGHQTTGPSRARLNGGDPEGPAHAPVDKDAPDMPSIPRAGATTRTSRRARPSSVVGHEWQLCRMVAACVEINQCVGCSTATPSSRQWRWRG